jgi:O-succinylbenzoic acid--CoA ligase
LPPWPAIRSPTSRWSRHVASLLEQGVKPPVSLRVALIGGAALSPQLYDRATQSGWPLYPSYGMSETAQFATFTRDGAWHAGCVGKIMPATKYGLAMMAG